MSKRSRHKGWFFNGETTDPNWLHVAEFCKKTGATYPTLYRWRKLKRCPLLGRALRIREAERKGRDDGPRFFVHSDEVEALVAARQPWSGVYKDGSGEYLSSSLACERFRLSIDALHGHREAGRVRAQLPLITESAAGRIRRKARWVWHAGDLTSLGTNAGELDWLTAAEVKDQYGWSQASLRKWRKQGCPQIGGRKLQARLSKSPRSRKYYRPDLDEIKSNYRPARIAAKDWLPYREAIAEFGVKQWQLSEWSRKRCAALGRLLATKEEFRGVGNRMMTVTLYSRRDLETITGIAADPQSHDRAAVDGNGAAETPAETPKAKIEKRGRKPATKLHEQWKAEHEAGNSYEQIARKHKRTRRSIIRAVTAIRCKSASDINSKS